MSESSGYGENSQAVQAHLGIVQSVIQRMSANSTSCKTWCITLVSAILVVVANEEKPQYALIAVVPTVLFFALDIYYLILEKRFRNSYNTFIDKLHDNEVQTSDVYAVTPSGSRGKAFLSAVCSFSTWPFYLTLLAMIGLAIKYVI
ncbi:hypothetical protein ACFL6S_14265 [Candidatus Poribacteria bacterium]